MMLVLVAAFVLDVALDVLVAVVLVVILAARCLDVVVVVVSVQGRVPPLEKPNQ